LGWLSLASQSKGANDSAECEYSDNPVFSSVI
jgi:hypothetical protein